MKVSKAEALDAVQGLVASIAVHGWLSPMQEMNTATLRTFIEERTAGDPSVATAIAAVVKASEDMAMWHAGFACERSIEEMREAMAESLAIIAGERK